jgi:hypothetical protein
MRTSSFLTLTLLCGAPLFGDCIDGFRDTTEAEKQFYTRTLASLKAVIPAAPSGWTLEDRNKITAPGIVCTGAGKLPMRGTYEVRFYWQDGIRELDAKNREFDKQIAALKQLPPDKQKEYDEIGLKGRDLEREARKLMATDKAEAGRLRAEGRELTKAAHDIRQAHLQSIVPEIEAIGKKHFETTGHVNTAIKLRIGINGYNLETPEGAQLLSAKSAAVAFTGPQQSLLAFGQWDRQGTKFKPVYTAGATTRVANVTLEMTGDPEHVKQLLSDLNESAITSLVTE